MIFALVAMAVTSCSDGAAPLAYGIIDADCWMVASSEAGQIVRLDIHEGQRLDKGACVGLIDTLQLHLQYEALATQIASLRNTLPDVGKQVDVLLRKRTSLENEAERVRPLVEAGSISSKQLDKIEDELGMIDSQIAATKSSLSRESASVLSSIAALKAQADILKDRISRCSIVNPEAGTVSLQAIHEHEFVSVGMPIYKLSDYENMFVDSWFDGAALACINLGDSLIVKVDAPEGMRSYEGTVIYIAEEAEFTPNKVPTRESRAKQVYRVKLSLHNDGFLKAGLSADIFLPAE